MKTFFQFLQEKEFRFAKAKDNDYTGDSGHILVFSPKEGEEYKLNPEKLHDLRSHALKHAVEFDSAAVIGICKNCIAELQSYCSSNPNQFVGIYARRGGLQKETGLAALSKIGAGVVVSTMDMVADKFQLKLKLQTIENIVLKHSKKIERLYADLISKKLDKAIDLDKIKGVENIITAIRTNPIIRFDCYQKTALTCVLDFTDNSIIIESPDYVRTMFVFDRTASGYKGTIQNFYKRDIKIEKLEVAQALRTV
jgi:hypothetical protein